MNSKSSVLAVFLVLAVAGAVWYVASDSGPGPGGASPEVSRPDPWAQYAQEELTSIRSAEGALEYFVGAGKILSRYRVLRNKVRGTKWEARASQQEAAFRDSLQRAAGEELEKIRALEKPLREQKADAKVLTLYNSFPGQFVPVTPEGEIVADEIRILRSRIRDRFIGDRKILEEHLKQWELEEARNILVRMEGFTSDELRKDIDELEETIVELERARSVQVQRYVADQYLTVDQQIRAAMKKRNASVAVRAILRFLEQDWRENESPFVYLPSVDYAELIRLIRGEQWKDVLGRTQIDPETPSHMLTAQEILLDLRCAALVSLFRKKAEEGLALALDTGEKSLFEFQRARGSKSYLIRKEGHLWLVVGEDRIIPLEGLGSFPTVDLVTLGIFGWGKETPSFETSPWGQMAAGLLFHFSGSAVDFGRSRQYLQKAKELGMKGVDVYLSTLSASQTDRQEMMIRQEIHQVENWIRKHKYEEAWVTLDTLLRESSHPLVVSKKEELAEKLTLINAKRTVLKKLSSDFRAPVTYTSSGRLQVKYDFSMPKQIEAFGSLEKAGGHSLRGRWKWRQGVMESATFPSAMQWKIPMKGDLDIFYELTPMEDPQNIVIDLFYHPGGKKHYAVVFGFDWVGRANGDPQNEVEEKFGMPRTCILKYPVDVLLRDWELPGTWARWKERLVGGAVQSVSIQRETTHYVRILREEARLQLHVDGKLVWEGEDAEYREGFLLFYSDCRTRIDNLRIRFDATE